MTVDDFLRGDPLTYRGLDGAQYTAQVTASHGATGIRFTQGKRTLRWPIMGESAIRSFFNDASQHKLEAA